MMLRSKIASAFVVVAATGLALALGGCAPPLEPQFVRARDLGAGANLTFDRPIVIEFDEGDIIPLTFVLDGPFVKSVEGAPQIPLRVVRHFFLRIDKSGLKASADGKSFDVKPVAPGQFQAGVGLTKAGATANVTIRTPTPPGLAK